MEKPDPKTRRDALYEQIEAADLACAEARVKELKARRAHAAAQKAMDVARGKFEELYDRLRSLDAEAAADATPEGGAA